MNLRELTDELRDNILYDRSDSVSGDPDQLWTDATLVRYINEAQRRFARRGLVIRDSVTSEVVDVTLVEGQRNYTLHPAIISVVSASLEDAETDLVRVGHSALGSFHNPCTMMWDPVYDTWPAGAVRAYATDEQLAEDDDSTIAAVTMRVFPEPDADADGTLIKLRVVRMPLDDLTANNMSAVPEIPRDHHMDMLTWAAYLALRINDVDAGNLKRADYFAQQFEAHVQEARKLVLRKLFVPQGWGFGRGGWSWGS